MASAVDRTAVAKALTEHLACHGGVHLAVLFGSRARGTEGPSSDVDLAVEARALDRNALSAELTAKLGLTVDVVDLSTVTIPLMDALMNDGIVVFEERRGAGAAWRSRALIELETDRPWYRRMRDAWLHRVAKRGFSIGQ